MHSEFLNIIVHPKNKTPLQLDASNQFLIDIISDERFEIKNGVPVLLINSIDETLSQSHLHQQSGTQFQYKEHYQNDAEAYDYTASIVNPIEAEEIKRLHQNILSKIPSNAELILDIGCGGAWLAKELVPRGKIVISTDISDINPIKAIQNLPSEHHWGLVADVFDMPIKAQSLDCIVASEIIEHVPNPKLFIEKLFELLKPNGTIIITTPYNEFIRTSLCIHCNRLTPQNAHLHSFNEANLNKMKPQKCNQFEFKVFNSKLLVHTHVQHLLRFLPLKIWNVIDQFALKISKNKAFRIRAVFIKN